MFARWLKRYRHATTSAGGGVDILVSEFGQAVECNRAYANAYANVLRKELEAIVSSIEVRLE